MTNATPEIAVHSIQTAQELPAAVELFREYANSLGFDLCFQGFEEELHSLLTQYGPPEGRLLLAAADGASVGCVALRRIDDHTCEMKRLYVRPHARHLGIGRTLCEAALQAARDQGYRRMRLDTLGSMESAVRLYRSLGFVEIPPYRLNPLPGALYFERNLDNGT